jgi:ribosomal protein L29
MAKKKANNKSNAASVETMPRSSSDDAASPPQSSTIQQEQKPVEAMSVEELRTELLAARAELAKSKGQTAGKLAQPQEVQELHVKLQQLRKEQQEADAARDKAWSQLKVQSAAQGRLAETCVCR